MLKNHNYVYGPKDITLPVKLQFADFMLQRMLTSPEKIALINGVTEENHTYGQIAQEAMNLAISLGLLGLRKGDTVAICTENRPEFWSVVVAVASAGAVVTTINQGYVEGEIRHLMKISSPKYLFCSPTTYKALGNVFKTINHIEKIIIFGNDSYADTILYNDLAVPPKTQDGRQYITGNRLTRNIIYEDFETVDVVGQTDTLFILYSSGTTGLPKGVMLTHYNVISVCCLPTAMSLGPPSLSITPWYHTMGLMSMLCSFSVQRTVIYLPRFEVDLYLRTIEKHKIAQLTVVPPIVVAICKSKNNYDLSSVTLVISGAAPLHKDTADLMKTKFPNVKAILQGYGMTETTLAVTRDIHTSTDVKLGSVGVATHGVIIKIADLETRKALGPNQKGEICIKGPSVMKGYVGKDRSEDFDDEGFLKSGDIGYYDDDRRFFIVDRLKELIKYKGYQVAPAELEALLLQHKDIIDAGVVAIPDSLAGELPLAFVVKQPGSRVTEKEIQKFVADRVSNPKHLRGGVRFVNSIPKNPSGKILRKELRKMAKQVNSKL